MDTNKSGLKLSKYPKVDVNEFETQTIIFVKYKIFLFVVVSILIKRTITLQGYKNVVNNCHVIAMSAASTARTSCATFVQTHNT